MKSHPIKLFEYSMICDELKVNLTGPNFVFLQTNIAFISSTLALTVEIII